VAKKAKRKLSHLLVEAGTFQHKNFHQIVRTNFTTAAEQHHFFFSEYF